MRWPVAALVFACAACASGQESGYVGPLTIGSAADTSETTTASGSGDTSDTDGDTEESEDSAGNECTGECEPGEMDTRACPGMCAVQERVCEDTCDWGAWSVCGTSEGPCEPGETMSCGMCMTQTCGDDCQWGACEAIPCVFECQSAARNGCEICDDEGFQMPDDGQLFLYCDDANGGVAYVANNTGPEQMDGVARCQGWEDMGLNAWDYLDYVLMMTCDEAGKYLPIELPPGTISHFGVHDQPAGGGHFTTVCVAVPVP